MKTREERIFAIYLASLSVSEELKQGQVEEDTAIDLAIEALNLYGIFEGIMEEEETQRLAQSYKELEESGSTFIPLNIPTEQPQL
jgi:hypothetical protein